MTTSGFRRSAPDLSEWAVENHTPYADMLVAEVSGWTDAYAEQMRKEISLLTRSAMHTGGWSAAVAEAWVLVCVCAPTWETARVLSELLCGTALAEEQEAFAAWLTLGALAPWAYAAGLTPAEVEAAGGALEMPDWDALLMLMSLRGWRLPPLVEADSK